MRCLLLLLVSAAFAANPPIHVMFHWHMHQPIYYPYESVVTTIEENRFDDLLDVFTSRSGDYNQWPIDAITTAHNAGLTTCGAGVSYSGALQENLNNLGPSGLTDDFQHWNQSWVQAQTALRTSGNNPAIYLTAFGYHHPLMSLQDTTFTPLQIQLHRLMIEKYMGTPSSGWPTGLFPPENSFSPRMIPALLEAGITWVLVDNIHFDRAHVDYPWDPASNLYPPNPADQRNNQTTDWIQLQNLWAPGKVSAPFGYRPYWVEYVDPTSGNVSRIIAVPGARYEGVEDGRGGYGAFLYQQVMDQYAYANTDPTRPMMVLLAHDGDNYGGGTDSYYHGNFDNFVSWISSVPEQYQCSIVQDYLQQFPVPDDEVIWVEDGSWSGANNGDPQFLKWNPNFFQTTYEPERNSWAVMTAGMNILETAQSIAPWQSLENILLGEASSTSTLTELALHWFLCSQASDYEYWPGEQIWDSDPTRAVNQAATYAAQVVKSGKDTVGPTILLPQRQYWNPGAINWNTTPDPSDFDIWTVAYDFNGISQIQLRIRVTPGKLTPTSENFLYGDDSEWKQLPMTDVPLTGSLAPTTDPLPLFISDLYKASVVGVTFSLVDYYIYAVDNNGNSRRTPIQHVYVAGVNSEK